jgi:hypothetical protein
MNKRDKYKQEYKDYLKSKNKLPNHLKLLDDYNKASDHAPKFVNKNKKRTDNFFGLSGVYFLLQGYTVVYVGESSCIFTRLSQHYKEGLKDFEFFYYKQIEGEEKRKKEEKRWIKKLRPIYNSVHNPNLR